MKSQLILLSIVTCLVACSDELSKKDEPKTQPKVTGFSREAVTSEVIPTSEPNKYQVVLRWEPTSHVLMVTRAGAPQVKLTSATTELSEVLDGGKTYEYIFETYMDGKSQKLPLTNVKVEVPYDYVFKGEKKLTGDLVVTANRIFVNADAVVTAQRHKIVLKAKEFISKGGKFQSYTPASRDCPKRGDGYAGGDITIDSETATGTLNISMMGSGGCGAESGGNINGGPGGKLTVRAKRGESLLLNLTLAASAGAPKYKSFLPEGKLGAPPTTCIALSGEDSCG